MTTLPSKVSPGDPFGGFPADFYNSLIDTVEQVRNSSFDFTGDQDGGGIRPFGLVWVKNASGADRAILDVLLVSDSLLTPAGDTEAFRRNVMLSGTVVSTTLSTPFVVCAQAIKNNDYGWAYCSGIFPARINVGSASHTHAGLKASDSTQLDSSFAGNARIIYKESGTGASKLAVIQYPVVPVGVTTSPTTLGSSSEGSETADTTSWTRSSSGAPLDVWQVCRTVYNHAGDKKLYSFVRKFSYDSLGLLIAVSAETRIEVDAAESC